MDIKDFMPDLSNQAPDSTASLIRSSVGLIPFAGSFLAELVNLIPNQRIDRIAKYCQCLNEKTSHISQDLIRSQLTNEYFTDLCEESMRQASQSLSDERREYIASIIANSLSAEKMDYINSKYLLKLLGQINDIEVILLRFFFMPFLDGDREFREKHRDLLYPPPLGLSISHQNQNPILQGYKEHLVSLGLLERKYEKDRELGFVKMGNSSDTLEVKGYTMTAMGNLLLEHIGIVKGHWTDYCE